MSKGKNFVEEITPRPMLRLGTTVVLLFTVVSFVAMGEVLATVVSIVDLTIVLNDNSVERKAIPF
jgi:hypothetical protein